MFPKGKSALRLVAAAAILITAVPAISAEESDKNIYTLASLQGDYALVGVYGSDVARLNGVFTADGNGSLSGSAQINAPGSGGQRVLVAVSFAGTYTITPDGLGVIAVTIALPNGATTPATIDLLLTKLAKIRGTSVAVEATTMQREPSSIVGGEFIAHTVFRRGD
jgi:hypothetical protein